MPLGPFTQFDPSDILVPAQRPEDARQDAIQFGPNLTFVKGDMIAISTVDKKAYRYAVGGANGLAVAKAIAMYSFRTDTNGMVYFGTEAPGYHPQVAPSHTAPGWLTGIFAPGDIKIAGVAATFSQVSTAFQTLARELHNGFIKVL